MGKSNRPLVVKIKPGQNHLEALLLAANKPRHKGKPVGKIKIRVVGK